MNFGNLTIEIVCDERNSIEDPVDITVKTSKSFYLIINNGRKIVTRIIEAGTHKYRI